ncbi:pentatricopeptide repeat-containing protein At1g80270, mitochondrial-like [Impatiens glandulifera]|uniref:pentatricopeptide repeat-containing protein At1g80270, mitochondrial-like n=1 Tax=Impatiens glandulifera TaxID=253017 RepID=UPI001FB11CBA|nr:pentatricopeptide repeat-containing protein At1g80270, mitochondrial-like [Impatiens glandulifera]
MFYSHVRATDSSNEEDDIEDGFSELEPTVVTLDGTSEDGNKDELVSEPELSEEDEHYDVEEQSNETRRGTDKGYPNRKSSLMLLKSVTDSSSVENALDKWIEGGNEVHKTDIYFLMVNLRKRRMYGKALQLSEWLESNKKVDFVERDYASRLDLISKTQGLQNGESYIGKIPESFRGEVVYRTLLANCAMTTNVKKAEEVFNKMMELGFPVTAFACNQLLLLHKRSDKNKIADVLQLMEKENVKPTLFTYHILIDAKGQAKDIQAIDQIFETMKEEGTEPDNKTLALIAKYYVLAGFKEKAKAFMKEIEGKNTKDLQKSAGALLSLYSGLGEEEEVRRIWKACEATANSQECLSAIEAFGKLNKVEEAEAVFNGMQKRWKFKKNPCLKQYTMLLKVYVDHKMLTKGKDLVKQMVESGLRIGPWTWDVLVNLYVVSGEVEKADSILTKAAMQNQMKPLFQSYMTIMEEYSKRGDVHNTEKMFYRMRQAGYVSRVRQFVTLVRAYAIAKVPAYGIKERIKADNIVLSKGLAAQLVQVDAFKRNPVSDLLD